MLGNCDRVEECVISEAGQNGLFPCYKFLWLYASSLSLSVISSPSSDLIPADSNATYRDTDGGHSGPYVAAHLFPGTACSQPISTSQPTHNLGIFQVGSEESCLPAQTCNELLRSNMTYRGRYVLMNGRTPILISQWSQPFTTRA
eukprot:g32688.t1